MSKERQTDPALIQPGLDPTEVLQHIRKWNESFREDAAFNPPFTHDEVHRLISSPRPSQADLLRQADAYLLTLCLLLLALESSILWHTLPLGHTVLNIATIVLGVISLWGAYRATLSLYYQWQMHRLRHRPYRMLRYSDLLHRLSHRRRWWINTVLWPNSPNANLLNGSRRQERLATRIPAHTFATICLALIVGVTTWLVLNNRHSDGDTLLAYNHTSQPATVTKPDSTFEDTPCSIAPAQFKSALATPQASFDNSKLDYYASVTAKSQIADSFAVASHSSIPECPADEDKLHTEEELMVEPIELLMDSRLAATEVLCNRGDCSLQQYYEIFCSIVMNNN